VRVLLLLTALVFACNSDKAGSPPADSRGDAPAADAGTIDRQLALDAGGSDFGAADQRGPDARRSDAAGKLDAAKKIDAAIKVDAALKADAAKKPDAPLPKPDSAPPKPDSAPPKPDQKNTTGLTVPCQHGPGYTLFRFHYGGGSTSPGIDVWDATCSYSYAPGSACNIYAVYPGFGSVSYTSEGYPILTTSEYLRVRFSVAGLSFTKAAVYIAARSYSTSASTDYAVWSPIYGGLVTGPVDNDWIYDWYGLDWTGYLDPSDSPSLTAIQIYADQGSGELAVKAVELCVQ
jgi:hypothetical protein